VPGYWTPASVGVGVKDLAVTGANSAEFDGPNCTTAADEETTADGDDTWLWEAL